MKQFIIAMAAGIIIAGIFGCSSSKGFHGMSMPDPEEYQAHFGDLDTNDDGAVTWEEFKAYFPDGQARVFNAIDLNQNGTIDHNEWHRFKEAHGLRHTG